MAFFVCSKTYSSIELYPCGITDTSLSLLKAKNMLIAIIIPAKIEIKYFIIILYYFLIIVSLRGDIFIFAPWLIILQYESSSSLEKTACIFLKSSFAISKITEK